MGFPVQCRNNRVSIISFDHTVPGIYLSLIMDITRAGLSSASLLSVKILSNFQMQAGYWFTEYLSINLMDFYVDSYPLHPVDMFSTERVNHYSTFLSFTVLESI